MRTGYLIKSVAALDLRPGLSVILSHVTTPGPGPWWSYLSGASNSVLSVCVKQ